MAGTASLRASSKTEDGFLAHYDGLSRADQARYPKLRQIECAMTEQGLTLGCRHTIQYNLLSDPINLRAVRDAAREFFGRPVQVEIVPPQNVDQSRDTSSNAVLAPDEHPLVVKFVEQFEAKVISVEQRQSH